MPKHKSLVQYVPPLQCSKTLRGANCGAPSWRKDCSQTKTQSTRSAEDECMMTTTMLIVLPLLMYDDADDENSDEIWCTMVSYKDYTYA